MLDGIGIVRAVNSIIGGLAAGAGNIIVGNGRIGVGIFEAAATGNVVQGNFIGTTDGTTSFGNASDGVHVSFTASNNTIGVRAPAKATRSLSIRATACWC